MQADDRTRQDLPPPPPGPAIAGFALLEELGEGSFGAVWRARDQKLDREVAVKVLRRGPEVDPSACERFLAEARTLARVRHTNVLAVHAVIDASPPDALALVTELIDGSTLSEVIEEQGPMSAQEAARVGIDLCRALAAVHAAGIVHRDLKPLNVMRERGGRIVLLDFGLGVFTTDGRARDDASAIAGSPLFMAPEQILGEEVTPRTDIYALGVLLYHLATGKYPVATFQLRELFAAITHGELRPLRDARPDLPEAFVQVVTRALSRDPRGRYASAGEMEQALLASIGSAGGSGRLLRRQAVLWISGIALGTMALVLGLLLRARPGASPLELAAFHLEASTAPIRDGARISGGGRLQLDVRLREAMHLYVLNEDERGNVYILFPRRASGPKNPLAPGALHRLPGPDESWEASTGGGKELLLIVASSERDEILEEAALREQLSGDEVARLLRGFPKVVTRKEGPASARALVSAYLADLKAAGGIPEGGEGTWLREGVWISALTLENR